MKILITGGCGFVGSNLAINLKNKYSGYKILCLDNLKRRGSELSLSRLKESGVEFIHGDIRSKSDVEKAGEFDVIIEAAAEPSVLAGINESTDYVIDTNLNGTINCLNVAKKHDASFIFLSTSRVYPIPTIEQAEYVEEETRFAFDNNESLDGISKNGITESLDLKGYRSLYGATKLCSELMIQEYNSLFNLKSVINRCGVITGPHQMGKVDQGVIVLWAARHFWEKDLNYIGYGGEGKQVRDILHIHDLFRLVDWQIHNIEKVNSETFNVGGGLECSVSLRELTVLCENHTNNKININKIPETRVADLRLYITDNSKVTNATGWKPEISPDDIIREIVDWIRKEESILKPILY